MYYLNNNDWTKYSGEQYIIINKFDSRYFNCVELKRLFDNTKIKGVLIISETDPETWYTEDERSEILTKINEVLTF